MCSQVSEVLPKEMPWNLSLFSHTEDEQRDVAERLLVAEQCAEELRIIQIYSDPFFGCACTSVFCLRSTRE